jgi:hypothetical protein
MFSLRSYATPIQMGCRQTEIVWSIWKRGKSWYILTWKLTSSKVDLIELPKFEGYSLTLSPNGKYIVAYLNEYIDSRSHMSVLDGRKVRELASNNWPHSPTRSKEHITTAQFSAEGEMLAVGYADGQMRVFRGN